MTKRQSNRECHRNSQRITRLKNLVGVLTFLCILNGAGMIAALTLLFLQLYR